MLPRHRAPRLSVAAILLATSLLTSIAWGAPKFWDTSTTAGLQSGSGTWDTGTTQMWSSSTAGTDIPLLTWANDDDATFRTTGTDTVTVSGTILINSLTNNVNAATAGTTTTLNGGTLQFDSNTGILNNVNSSTATVLTINSAIVLNSANITFNAANNIVVGGAIGETGGARAITKSGSANLTLNGANTWSGGTTISGGLLQFGAASTVPATGSIVINAAGVLAAAGPAGFTTATGWLTSGRIANTSTGALAFTASSNETLDLSATGFNYNSLYLGATGTFTYSGALTPGSGGYLLGGGGGTLTVSSPLSTATSLTVNGNSTSTVILTNAANSFTGPITIGAAGILRVTSAGALGNATSITTVAGNAATLQLSGGFTVGAGKTITINGAGTGSAGALSSIGGSNNWAGNVVLGSSAARIGTTSNGTTFTISGVISDGGLGFDLAIRNANGATGTVLLNNANTYRGNTQIVVGTLQLGATNTLPNTSVLMGNNAGQGTTILDLNGFNQTVSGVASVAGNTIPANVINGSATTSTLTIAVNGSATSTSNQGANAPKIVTFGGTGNNFNLTKAGTGTYSLFGAHTYTGATTVNGGTLVEDFNYATGITGAGASFSNDISSGSNLVMAGGTFQVKGHGNGTVASLTGASWALTSQVVTVPSTTGLAVGQTISSTTTGIPAGSYIVSILSTTQVLINAATTVAGTAAPLTLGANDATTSQTLNGLTVNAGAGVVDASLNTGNSVTLDLRGTSGTMGITRTVGGTIDFRASTGVFAGTAVVETAQANDPTGVLGTYATVTTASGTDWAANDGTGKIVAYTGYTDINATGSSFSTLTATNNVRMNAAGPGGFNSLGGLNNSTTEINSLVQNTTTASSLDISSQTLRLGVVGGIMIEPGKSSLTLGTAVNAGSLTAGGPTDNNPGELVFINNAATGVASAIVVNATIVDNGLGAVTVTKSGVGDLQLISTANTYSGKTYLNGGITKIFGEGVTNGSLGAIPGVAQADNLNFNGGTLQFASAFNLDPHRGITTSGNGATLDTQTFGITYAGNITGSGSLTKIGTSTLTLSGIASDYTGLTTVSAGTLNITTASALGSAFNGTTVANNASLSLSGSLSLAEPLTITGGGTTGLDGAVHSISGNNVLTGVINATTTTITRVVVDAGQLTLNGNIVSSASGSVANGLTFQGNGTVLVNGSISGSTPVTRSTTGTGLVILAAVNTYTGATSISNGTIQVGLNGVGTTGSAGVAVNTGTLAGSGMVNGLATIASGANLSPGDTGGTSVGTLTFANGLTFTAGGGAIVKMDLGTSSDLILLTGGTFTSNSSGVTTFNITPGSGFGNGVYNLIDWSNLAASAAGVDPLTDFTATGLSAGLTGTFQLDGTGRILQIVVTPEPARVGLLAAGVLALVLRRRR